MASVWGGSGVQRAGEEECKIYVEAAKHFEKLSDRYQVDVILSTHPFQDCTKEKLELIRNVNSTAIANPFILGREGCRLFEHYMIEKGEVALRAAQTQNNG